MFLRNSYNFHFLRSALSLSHNHIILVILVTTLMVHTDTYMEVLDHTHVGDAKPRLNLKPNPRLKAGLRPGPHQQSHTVMLSQNLFVTLFLNLFVTKFRLKCPKKFLFHIVTKFPKFIVDKY